MPPAGGVALPRGHGNGQFCLQKTDAEAPVYRRIQYTLRDRIEAGELQPGDAVPSETELARCHEVCLLTARHALTALEHGRLVDRRCGGTFAALPKIHFNRLASFTEQWPAGVLPARSRILYASIVDGEQEAAARLALPAHGQLVKLERLRQSGVQPFAVEICYFPAEEFAGLLSLPLERRSLLATLEREYGIELHYADEEVDATCQRPHRGVAGDSPRSACAAYSPGAVLDRRQSHRVRDRLLPLGPPHAVDPPLPEVAGIPACSVCADWRGTIWVARGMHSRIIRVRARRVRAANRNSAGRAQ